MSSETIYLHFSWRDVPVARLSDRLTSRFFGPLRWVLLILSVTVLLSTYAILSTTIYPDDDGGHMSVILAIVACVTLLGIGNTLGHKRLQAALMAAPLRQRDCALAINQYGINAEGGALHAQVDWADVTEIAEVGGFVLIMLSPLEYIPIPIFALPKDLRQSDLVAQLRQWHTDAIGDAGARAQDLVID